MIKHLTPELKHQELLSWEKLRARGQFTGEGEGGEGHPDEAIFSFCERLNALDGVCTMQSCAGHRRPSPDGGEYIYPGEVWLWLSESMFQWFVKDGYRLASRDGIEAVSVLYGRYDDDRAVVSIRFQGNESGRLRSSTEKVGRFFEEELGLDRSERSHAPPSDADFVVLSLQVPHHWRRLNETEIARSLRLTYRKLLPMMAHEVKRWQGPGVLDMKALQERIDERKKVQPKAADA